MKRMALHHLFAAAIIAAGALISVAPSAALAQNSPAIHGWQRSNGGSTFTELRASTMPAAPAMQAAPLGSAAPAAAPVQPSQRVVGWQRGPGGSNYTPITARDMEAYK